MRTRISNTACHVNLRVLVVLAVILMVSASVSCILYIRHRDRAVAPASSVLESVATVLPGMSLQKNNFSAA